VPEFDDDDESEPEEELSDDDDESDDFREVVSVFGRFEGFSLNSSRDFMDLDLERNRIEVSSRLVGISRYFFRQKSVSST
jgi:hypothetical protein